MYWRGFETRKLFSLKYYCYEDVVYGEAKDVQNYYNIFLVLKCNAQFKLIVANLFFNELK